MILFPSSCCITPAMGQVNPFLLSSVALNTVLPLDIQAQTLLAKERFLTLAGKVFIWQRFDMGNAPCAGYVSNHRGHANAGSEAGRVHEAVLDQAEAYG